MSKDDKMFELRSTTDSVTLQYDSGNGFRIQELEKLGLRDYLVRIHFGDLGYYKCVFVDGVDSKGNKINAVIQGSSSALGDKIQDPVPVFITGSHPVSPEGTVSTMTAMGFIGSSVSLEIHMSNRVGYLLTPPVERATFQDDPTEVARLRDYALPAYKSRIRACKLKKDLSLWISKTIPRVAGLFEKVSHTYVGDGILRVIDRLVNQK